jgi:phosphopantetheinyl transferase
VIRDARGHRGSVFFPHRESEAYLALDPRDRPLGFFNCWTRKEAFIKALGGGLSYPLDSIRCFARAGRAGEDPPRRRHCPGRLLLDASQLLARDRD